MSIFQDKKLLIHISLEIVILGSMSYFFHTKSKSLELRVKSVEEQFSKEISILQDNIIQMKKQLKKSEMAIEEIRSSKSIPPPPPQSVKPKKSEHLNIFRNFTTRLSPSTATVEVIDDNDDEVVESNDVEVVEVVEVVEIVENNEVVEVVENNEVVEVVKNALDKELENELKELEDDKK